MAEYLFRLLEIIGILLPLTGIFVQVSARVVDEHMEDHGQSDLNLLRATLLASAVVLGATGIIAAAVLSLRLSGWAETVVAGGLYIAFLLLTIGIATMWAWIHPGIPLPAGQQTLQGSTDKDENE